MDADYLYTELDIAAAAIAVERAEARLVWTERHASYHAIPAAENALFDEKVKLTAMQNQADATR